MEVNVNKFEKELLEYINDIFRDEIKQNIVEIEVNTPEFAKEQGYSYKGWEVGIRKTRGNLKDVRVVIESPDQDIMNEVKDYRRVLKTMVEQAKHILNNPPFQQYISQGVIRAMTEGEHVEFISKDRLREKTLKD
jgi:hypothetical protein